MINLNQAVLVTHSNCMDGSGCALVFLAAGGRQENIKFVSPNHRDVDELVSELLEHWAGPIIIADVSISSKLAGKIVRTDVLLFDHHKSAIPLAALPWCEIDVENSRCGSKILYEWLEKYENDVKKYKDLIELIDDNDRWIKEYEHSDTLSLFHEVLGQEMFIERFLKKSDPALDSMEHYVVNLETRKRNKYIENKKKNITIVSKYVGEQAVRIAFVNAGTHQSMLGNSICSDPSLNVDIAVMVGSSVSLRARKGCLVDLSKLAQKLGGGGHYSAGGCSLGKFLNNKELVDIVKDYLLSHEEIWNI